MITFFSGMGRMKVLSTLLTLSLASSVFAGSVKAPFTYSNTGVLPKNVRSVTVGGIASEVKNTYDNSGAIVGLGNALNKQITWLDLLDGEDDPVKRGEYEGFLLSRGVDLNELTGSTSGLINVAANVTLPIIGMGVTRKLTFAAAIPIVEVETKIDASAISGPALDRIANDLANDGKLDDANELREKYMNAISDKLEENNYKPLANEKKKKIGDIKLVAKYLLTNKKKYSVALQSELTLPTGDTADIDKLVDVPTGDGQTDVALGFVTDLRLVDSLTISTSIKYTAQLSDKQALRVPEKVDTKLTPDVDQTVERDLGDIFEASLGAKYSLTDWFNIVSAVNFSYKERDSFSGAKFDSERYNWMAINTEQNLTSFQAGLEFHTLTLFKKGKFKAPLKTTLNYSDTLRGKNAGSDKLYSLDLSLFF